MVSRPVDAIFQVTQITVVTSGTPSTNIDAHLTTRHGQPTDVIAVTVADVLTYCHGRASVHAFARTWARASQVLPVGIPDQVAQAEPNRHEVGVVLRVDGTPRTSCNGVGADANPTGRPFVRVAVGPLTVHAFDTPAITAWASAWAEALRVADRFWPVTDAFDEVEARAGRRTLAAGRRRR
jgi:hypothetical protein